MGSCIPHILNKSLVDTNCVLYNLTQFYCYLPEDNLNPHELSAHFYKTVPTSDTTHI